MNKQIFTSKERYILKAILVWKIEEYKKHKKNPLTSDFVKYEIDCTIKDIKKIIKKIDDPNYKEAYVSYNEMIRSNFDTKTPYIKKEEKNAKSKK